MIKQVSVADIQELPKGCMAEIMNAYDGSIRGNNSYITYYGEEAKEALPLTYAALGDNECIILIWW